MKASDKQFEYLIMMLAGRGPPWGEERVVFQIFIKCPAKQRKSSMKNIEKLLSASIDILCVILLPGHIC